MTNHRLTHVITALPIGGAQTMLKNVVVALARRGFESQVVSLADLGPVGRDLAGVGITVEALNLNPKTPNPLRMLRLVSLIRRHRTTAVQTWMYHADLVGGLAARVAGDMPCVWNIRNLDLSPGHTPRTTRWTVRACALLSSRLPQRIVCNSQLAATFHVELGYSADKIVIIPNGVNTQRFRPDASARDEVQRELGISPRDIVIGVFARYHPHKDFPGLLNAIAHMLHRNDVKVVLCGEGTDEKNTELRALVEATGLRETVRFLGLRHDVSRLMSAADIVASASIGEGFSNSIAEAMACGTPCVVTNAGDSAAIVGDTGRVVPPRSPAALAGALDEVVRLSSDARAALGTLARKRIENNFSLDRAVDRYEALYESIGKFRHLGS
jgi:glycosyltransferase involved in cell wall biosynthesis